MKSPIFAANVRERRTQFGQFGTEGRSFWKRVSFECKNPTLTDFSWSWEAASGHYPDQYQRGRLLQLPPITPIRSPGPTTVILPGFNYRTSGCWLSITPTSATRPAKVIW